MTRAVLVGSFIAVAMLAATSAQSPNAFGVPSTDQPQPGTTIKAVPGSRAQGKAAWREPGGAGILGSGMGVPQAECR